MLAGCIASSRPTGAVWVWNHECEPVDVVLDYAVGAPVTYRLRYGEGAVLLHFHPPGGGCNPSYPLPAELHGVVVRDASGRAVLVERGRLRGDTTGPVWQADVDDALLRQSQPVDAGAYFPAQAVPLPGQKDDAPAQRGHSWSACQGAAAP